MTQTPITHLSSSELDALITRVNEAIEHDLALSRDDIASLLSALLTLAQVQETLEARNATVTKLRKLLGMVRSSEKLQHLFPDSLTGSVGEEEKGAGKTKTKARPQDTRKRTKKLPPKKVIHPLVSPQKGERCADCGQGKLYKYEPAQLLRITGHPPLQAELHLSERLRCNACGVFITAQLPPEVQADGGPSQKYGYSARAMMALNKFFAGTPYYRLQRLQAQLNQPVSASTIFDQCEHVANALQPIFITLCCLAATAWRFLIDDTPHRILDQQPVFKKRRQGNGMRKRTGVYTSGLIAQTDAGQSIVLFNTSIGHAGEWVDEILSARDKEKPPPLLMSDALSSNRPTTTTVVHTLCNSHSRRKFADLASHYPDSIQRVLQLYAVIWQNEKMARQRDYNARERQQYHHQHSLLAMTALRDWGQTQLDTGQVEHNGDLDRKSVV